MRLTHSGDHLADGVSSTKRSSAQGSHIICKECRRGLHVQTEAALTRSGSGLSVLLVDVFLYLCRRRYRLDISPPLKKHVFPKWHVHPTPELS